MREEKPKTAGRPRSIDLEALLAVAARMDLSTITMKSLAEQLGVGVATVYRYVKDRDALVRLASARAAHRALPLDRGQSWQALILAYADSMFSALSGNPALLHAYLDGHLGVELEIELVDHFLAAMTRRGFSSGEALGIFRAIGTVSMGTAAATVHMRALGGFSRSVEVALDQREMDELPRLRAARQDYVDLLGTPDLAAGIAALISGISGPATEAACTADNYER